MAQDTTVEFAFRLQQAMEGNPLAPPTPHGRQAWLLRELTKRKGIEVSTNTVSKWVNGQSRPREDRIRALAQVLSVDEVWLALGKKPVGTPDRSAVAATVASGAVMLAAGLIEVSGGRVTFSSEAGGPLSVNFGGAQFGLLVVTPQKADNQVSFIVPEPVGDNRIVGVMPVEECAESMSVKLLKLTDAPRQQMGGFSIIRLDRQRNGGLRFADTKRSVTPMKSVAALIGL